MDSSWKGLVISLGGWRVESISQFSLELKFWVKGWKVSVKCRHFILRWTAVTHGLCRGDVGTALF